MFWMKPLDLAHRAIMCTNDWYPTTEGIKVVMQNDHKIHMTLWQNNGSAEHVTVTVSSPTMTEYLNIWFHLTVVGHSDLRFSMFINGVEQVTTTTTGVHANNVSPSVHRMVIGRSDVRNWGAHGKHHTLDMLIDELILYSRPLSVTEVQMVYYQYVYSVETL